MLAALVLTFYLGQHLPPVFHDETLSPFGTPQSGWPLPFAASFWDDSVVNPHQAQKFNVVFFLINVSLIFGALLLIEKLFTGKIFGKPGERMGA